MWQEDVYTSELWWCLDTRDSSLRLSYTDELQNTFHSGMCIILKLMFMQIVWFAFGAVSKM